MLFGLGNNDLDADTLNYLMRYYSEYLGLPSNTLMAIAMAESSYNPETGQYYNGYSWRGAMGLMQLMPIALKDIRQRYGVELDPFNPAQAILGAAMMFQLNRIYLRYYTKQNPSWYALIVSYNGGFGMGLRYMRGQPIAYESAMYLAKVANATGIA